MRRTALLSASIVLLSLALVACGDDTGGGGDGRLTVAASFYPLQEIAQQVGGDAVRVVTLVAPGSEAHEYEPTAKQLTALQDADVVLYLGDDFQPSVEKAISDLPGGVDRVDLLEAVALLPVGTEIGAGEEEEEHGDWDPHVWLAPGNMEAMAQQVADSLAAADPDRADEFHANADAYAARLAALDSDMAAGLAECRTPYLVTGHHAFGYLADAYGLTQVSISGISPAEEPSAATLEDVAKFAREHDITTIFFEENLPDDLSRTVADEIGATTAVLDPVESPSSDQLDAGASYESLMRENLEALRAGLGCA